MGYVLKHYLAERFYKQSIPTLYDNRQDIADRVYYSYQNTADKILKENLWQNKRCFIIGGGPSLSSFDFSLLRGELVIGVNKAFLLETKYNLHIHINYTMDMRFLNWIKDGSLDRIDGVDVKRKWEEFKGIKLVLSPLSKYPLQEDIYVIRRRIDKDLPTRVMDGIYGGNNSGFGAVMLAILLGANPIYLLGFDMDVDIEKEKTHFHNGYPSQTLRQTYMKSLRYIEEFNAIQPLIFQRGVNVINLNPNSGIKCFKFGIEKIVFRDKILRKETDNVKV